MTDVVTQEAEQVDGAAEDHDITQGDVEVSGDQPKMDEDEESGDPEGDDPEADPAEGDDEYEDIERDGKSYKLPKALKADLLRMDDYTRKTMAHAENVKAFEARVQGFDAATKVVEKGRIDLAQVNERLSALQELTPDDWREIDRMDRANGTRKYDELQREMLALPNKAAEITKTLEAEGQKAAEAQRELTVKRQGDAEAILQREISGWSPEVGAKLADFIQTKYGVTTADAGTAKFDAALVKMAHAAQRLDALEAKNATAKKAADVTKNPPPKVAKRAAPGESLETLSAAEFAKRRNAQLAKKYT